jgi:hypothetical protein
MTTTSSDKPATCTRLPFIIRHYRGTEGVRGRAYAREIVASYARTGVVATIEDNPECTCPRTEI